MRIIDIIFGIFWFSLTVIVGWLAIFGATQLWEINHPYEFNTSKYRSCSGVDCEGIYTDSTKFAAMDFEDMKPELLKIFDNLTQQVGELGSRNPDTNYVSSSIMGNFKEPNSEKEYGFYVKISNHPNYSKEFSPQKYAKNPDVVKNISTDTHPFNFQVMVNDTNPNAPKQENAVCWKSTE